MTTAVAPVQRSWLSSFMSFGRGMMYLGAGIFLFLVGCANVISAQARYAGIC